MSAPLRRALLPVCAGVAIAAPLSVWNPDLSRSLADALLLGGAVAALAVPPERHGDALPRFYEVSDEALARIERCASASATLLVVSDHGQRSGAREGGGTSPIARSGSAIRW